MKLRLIDWLECPECGAALSLVDGVVEAAHLAQETTAPSECETCRVQDSPAHREAGVGTRVCALCYSIEVVGGRLVCGRSHEFPLRSGVPILLSAGTRSRGRSDVHSSRDPERISSSFSREWAHFDYDDRTWAMELQARTELFLKELAVDPESLRGKIVLDAGCGNGSLSRSINRFGCEVVGIDVSESVERAYHHFAALGNDRTHFIRGDLMRHPLRSERFDFVFSSGVLHHNPDTRAAFESVLKTLKPGGKIYIWVYSPIPGWRHALKQRFRAIVAPLPDPVKHAVVLAWSVQSMARQGLRRLFGVGSAQDHLRWRERLVLLLDHYTPRYRWEHTEGQVHSWYRASGLQDVRTTEVRDWGFGVVGTKPLDEAASAGSQAGIAPSA
jgi:SAM-dependent methyltransferase/uncharacterized protein YbaR (Trm112 family)